MKSLLVLLLLLAQPLPCIAEINSIDAEFPAKPSLVPNNLLGVNRDNWKTFSLSCRLLDNNISAYRNRDKWGLIMGEIEGKSNWGNCLKDIQRVKESLVKYRKLKLQVVEYRDEIVKKTGKQFPLSTLNKGIYDHLKNKEELNKNTLYAVDVYRCNYKILQLLEDGTGLYYDINNKWPPIFLIPPQGVELQESSYINLPADYYSYEGVQKYTTNTGFKKNAFVFKGHVQSGDFKKVWVQALQAHQWIDGDVNTSGM